MNRTIKKVGEDADNLKANTAIAALMTMLNEFYDKGVNKAEYKTFLALLNPFAPHITEELWQQLGETGLLSVAPWPTYDEAKTVESTVELAVQVNGKLKCTIKLAVDADKQTAIDTAMAEEKVQHAIEGKQIVKADRCSGQDRKPCRKVRRNAGFPRQKRKNRKLREKVVDIDAEIRYNNLTVLCMDVYKLC